MKARVISKAGFVIGRGALLCALGVGMLAFGILAGGAVAAPAPASSLIKLAGDIQRIEGRLQALEARLDDLQTHGAGLEADYMAAQDKMAVTLAAMARMQRVPREAILVRPGGPLQAARTQMALRSVMPIIEKDGATLRTLWQELSHNKEALATQTAEARDAKDALVSAHDSLKAAMVDRNSNGRLSGSEAQEHAQAIDTQIAQLALQAADLRDLLVKLSDEQMDGIQFIPQGTINAPRGGRTKDAEAAVLPVSGVVKTPYGGRDDTGAKAQGVHIRTIDGALVVAPLDGVVRYAGAFKGYGQIVIIAHKGGYHSLLAGLWQIDVNVGQNLVSGEPVGLVRATNDRHNQTGLYFELRLHGQAVNPARKIPDLG